VIERRSNWQEGQYLLLLLLLSPPHAARLKSSGEPAMLAAAPMQLGTAVQARRRGRGYRYIVIGQTHRQRQAKRYMYRQAQKCKRAHVRRKGIGRQRSGTEL
jgi:hypothetical protein